MKTKRYATTWETMFNESLVFRIQNELYNSIIKIQTTQFQKLGERLEKISSKNI